MPPKVTFSVMSHRPKQSKSTFVLNSVCTDLSITLPRLGVLAERKILCWLVMYDLRNATLAGGKGDLFCQTGITEMVLRTGTYPAPLCELGATPPTEP
jgi:hypothetical protein